MPQCLEITVEKFLFRLPTDCLYSADGVWARAEGNRVVVGLSDFLQQRLGDVAFLHIKPVGTSLAVGSEFAEIETIKVNQGICLPFAGKVVEVNGALAATPEIVNQDPYGRGWLAAIETDDWNVSRMGLLDAQVYSKIMRAQAEAEAAG
jgi:glycine cleavage system H protein